MNNKNSVKHSRFVFYKVFQKKVAPSKNSFSGEPKILFFIRLYFLIQKSETLKINQSP